MSKKTATKIKNVTVLGAGVLGSQIAFQCAFAGFNVISYDVNDDALDSAKKRFDKLAITYIGNVPTATADKLRETKQNLRLSTELADAVEYADLIIECVPENLEIKQQVWKEAGRYASRHCIFTTNTSSLLPSDFSKFSGDESRFLALHFANNIWMQPIVEVMGTEKTDDKIIAETMQFAIDMGMKPVQVQKEHAGYIMNSLLIPFLTSACRLYAKGVAEPSDIDKVWKLATASPKGAFEMMDIIGLRTVHAVYEEKAKNSKDPAMKEFAEIIKKEFLAKGRTGVESGRGFYDYG